MLQTQALRLTSLFLTFLSIIFVLRVQPLRWVNLYQGLLIAHYLLAAYYVKKGTFGTGGQRFFYLTLLISLTLLSYYLFPNLIFVLFGIHYAFGEAYNYKHVERTQESKLGYLIPLLSFFHLFAYLYAFSFNLLQFQIIYRFAYIDLSQGLKILCFSAFLFIFLYLLVLLKSKRIDFSNFSLLVLTEAFFVWAAVALAGTKYPFIIAIFYHITFWLVTSLYKTVKSRQGLMKVFNIVFFNFALVLISYLVTQKTSDIFVGKKDMLTMDMTIYILGFFHIYSSLFNENLNPAWISRLIRRKQCSSPQ